MLTFDSVKLRLDREQSLSYMEFNYMILQAYDFYKLNEKHKCLLQLGGSDQWGNIVNGVELIRRILQREAFGLTSPLITLASGDKMGKTEKGAIWLDEKLFSVYDYWQFWRNTDDRDVVKFLNFFTDIDPQKINAISQNKNINDLKNLLANEATKILHGEKKSLRAEITANETFKLGKISENLPSIKLDKVKLDSGIDFQNLLVENSIMQSKSEVRRAIKNNGIKINDTLLKDEFKTIKLKDFNNGILKVSFGKKETLYF